MSLLINNIDYLYLNIVEFGVFTNNFNLNTSKSTFIIPIQCVSGNYIILILKESFIIFKKLDFVSL